MLTKLPISLILFVVLVFAYANPAQAQKNPKRMYIADESKNQVKIPFKLINNLIVIEVKVNHTDTLNFILDTGITTTIVIAQYLSGYDSLKFLKDFWINGLGCGDRIPARHSPENQLEIYGVVGNHQDLLVIEESVPNFSNLLGISINGFIGHALFKDFIVEINYEGQYLILHKPRTYKYDLKNKKQVTLPLTFYDSKPHVDALAVQKGNTKVPTKLLVDLGVSYSAWLNLYSDPMLKLPEKNTKVFLGVGLNGLLSGRVGRLHKLVIDKFEFRNIIVNYPDTNSLGNALKMVYRNGSIGAGLLNRFKIIIDYRNQRLTLEPNKKLRKPFRYNMSGLEIETPVPGMPIYRISYIRENSPAARAGLQVGDQLLYINDRSVATLTLNNIMNIFLERPGRYVSIIYNRNGIEKHTIFKLEEII